MTRPRVVVIGLGPAGPDLTTAGAIERLSSLEHWKLRTRRHPAAEPFDKPSFDDVYESAATFDDVYRTIADDLVAGAERFGEVGYAIPGSPFVLERTVQYLLADDRVEVEIVPGMSFLDLAWGRIGVDPIEAGVRLVDGHRFAVDAADATGPLLVAHCHARHVLSDIKLAYEDDEPDRAILLHHLGLADETVTEVAWADIDRALEADHLTSLFIPAVRAPVASEVVRFDGLVRTLREQCPWDREQTHESLSRYLVEETYELVDAIAAYDPETGTGLDELVEELGDVLFQVVFHARIGAESGAFTLADVARGIHDKLHRRHPHVFGDAPSETDAIVANWEQIKRAEKGRESVLDGIPRSLPALLYAQKVIGKAGRVGASTPAADQAAADLGTALLALAARARVDDVDAEAVLRAAVDGLATEIRAHEAAADDAAT